MLGEIAALAGGSLGSAALGWYGKDLIEAVRLRLAARQQAANQDVLSNEAPGWLLEYYLSGGEGENLFALPNGRRIPYLTKPAWHAPLLQANDFETEIVTHTSTVEVDDRHIRRRQKLGQRVWDDPVLSLAGIMERGANSKILLGSCSYFQYLTVAEDLTVELIEAANRSKSTPLRDRKAASIDHLGQGLLDAQIAGFTTATVLTINDRPHVLIQRRSAKTGIAGGRLAVVPASVANTNQIASAKIEMARQLFYIELLEELYDREDLIKTLKRPTLDWLGDTWPINDLEASLGSTFSYQRLGFGFDAFSGEFHQAFLAHVTDEALSSEIVKQMSASWEVDDIQLHPVESEELKSIAVSELLYPTSAFTLALALEELS